MLDNVGIYSLIQETENSNDTPDRFKLQSDDQSKNQSITGILEISPITHDEVVLTALYSNQTEISQMINELTPEETIDIVTEIHNKIPRTAKHPNGYYDISLTDPNFQQTVTENGGLKLASSNSPTFASEESGYHAYYNHRSDTIFMRQEQISPQERLKSWLMGAFLVPGDVTEEQVFEHELRHKIFRKNFSRVGDIRSSAMNEAFATAIIDGSFEDDIPSTGSELEIEDDQKNLYFKIFRICQSLGINEVKLLRDMKAFESYIGPHPYAEHDDGKMHKISTRDDQFLKSVLNYLGMRSMDEIDQYERHIREDNEKMRLAIYNWKLAAWDIVYNKLPKKNPRVNERWEKIVTETNGKLKLRPELSLMRRTEGYTPLRSLISKIAKKEDVFKD